MTKHQPTLKDLDNLSAINVPLEEETRLEYTERAYRQDAEQAMKNNAYLALIELMTNSDDDMGARPGKITVHVQGKRGKPWRFTVTDDANGIPHTEINKKLVKLGSRTSGLEEGRQTRGNRGRGARDVPSLGGAIWETVHKGVYTKISIDRNGNVRLSKPMKLNDDQVSTVGLGKHGTRVAVECTTAPLPPHKAMLDKLSNLVPLRNIMRNKQRKVTLQYGDQALEKVTFTEPLRTLIDKATFTVPGYADKATLTLYESAQPFDEPPSELARIGGIIISSGRSVHQATLFDFENNPSAQRLSGELNWNRLDLLAKEYDDDEAAHRQHPASNPFPIIKRSREGLESTHPAFVALKHEVMPILARHVRRLESSAKSMPARESEETRRRLRALGNVLGDYWKQKNDELEESPDLDTDSDRSKEPLRIVPPRKRIDPEESAIFTVEAYREDSVPPPSVTLEVIASQPEDVVRVSKTTLKLEADPDDSQRYRGTFRVSAREAAGEALIEAACGSDRAELDVSVALPQPVSIPSTLQFTQDRYNVRPRKQKGITIEAPIHLVDRYGADVSLRVNSTEFSLKKLTLRLKLRPDGLFYMGSTTVASSSVGAKAKLVAGLDKLAAVSRVIVADEDERPTIDIKPEPIDGPQRAQVEIQPDGKILIKINTTHSAIKRYLGEHPDYPAQNTPLARVMMGEVAGKEIVAYFLRRYFEEKEVPIDTLDWKRVREEASLMREVHTVMLSDGEVASIQQSATAA